MSKALIVSLGEDIRPIIKSIEEHSPDYLFFFVSKESNAISYPKIKTLLDEKSLSPKIDFCMVRDVEDLVHCYEKASELAAEIEKQGIACNDVVVDYTTGTRTMTAALVLATVTKGYCFSYVGGKERDKGGLGIVKSGSEEIKTALSPWQVLLVEDRKKIALFFNICQFATAKNVADKLSENLTGVDKALFECLYNLIEGYRFWDSFNHNEALKTLGQGVKKLLEYLNLKSDPTLKDFAESAKGNLEFLATIKGNKEAMVFDLFHNAKRRAKEGKYDDAVARLYRALEMIGQIEFEKEFKCSTSNVKVERIPETLRDEIKRRHTSIDENSGEEKVKIGLKETFRVLNVEGNNFGSLFFAKKKEIDDVLEARNSSILAHGTNPISKERYEKLYVIVEDFLQYTEVDYKMEFPKLRWE